MAWSGATTTEKDAINFQRYYVSPTKLLTLVTLVGVGHLMMASIFAGSILSSPPPITYPKYTKDYWENSHFLRFSKVDAFSRSLTPA
jgi:hypothetical protein